VVRPLDAAKRMAYGATFVLGVPLLLVAWARLNGPSLLLPTVGTPAIGGAVALGGLALLAAGMTGLWVHGRGLPMNAFPPPRFVRQGVFRWVRDPIYLGFGLLVLGASLATRSPSGLWLVTPVTWLAMAALVLGYERHDLRRRFPEEAAAPLALSLPRPGPEAPAGAERVAILVRVLGPWLLVYYALQALGTPPDAFSTLLPFEARWPVVPWMELPYVSAYAFVPLAVVVTRSRSALRSFALSGIVGTVVVGICWVVIPVVAVNRPFTPTDWLGSLLAAEQASSAGVAAFPAFHVLWPMLAARAWSAERGTTARALAWGWAALIAASCLGTGHHGLVDIAAGALLYLPLRDVGRTWRVVLAGAERLANSWREWRLGPVRFINHGLYAGAAAAVGVAVAGSAAGPGMEGAVAWVGVWALLGAGTYAQVLEGSSRLLRPFGWYGGLIGGTLGVLTSPLVGGHIVPLLAAFALAAPWIQILGRCRCLVQGCCHGGPAPASAGIRYHHPRSRVNHLANLAGTPIHPTPLYSIVGNVVVGVLLVRLRMLSAPDTLLIGTYLMLSGCARFVEESYRGEPQTPLVAGLRVYQWFAVGTLLAGVVATMFRAAPTPLRFAAPSPALLAWAAAFFVLGAVAMGLDIPGSNRRFSRLAAAD
jgi:protein-S-isoprenylcysteine O-methyltransferase Ste14